MGKPIKYKKSIRKNWHESLITNRQDDILKSDFLILPGVGAFQNAMKLLNDKDLINVLNKFVLDKKAKDYLYLPWYANFIYKKL